jgi:hypothetical protein
MKTLRWSLRLFPKRTTRFAIFLCRRKITCSGVITFRKPVSQAYFSFDIKWASKELRNDTILLDIHPTVTVPLIG